MEENIQVIVIVKVSSIQLLIYKLVEMYLRRFNLAS